LGYSGYDGKPRFNDNYGANAKLPITRGFALFGSASHRAFDFFDNNPVPFSYAIIDVGIVKKFSKLLSLTADVNNLTQINNGSAPFPSPNTIHRVYLAIAADLHLASKFSGGLRGWFSGTSGPERLPAISGIALSAIYVPAGSTLHVGGD
jgi:hypothetical protein